MLYLEDYLEMIEHLPQELRDRFTEMREMDLQVHNAMDSLDEQVKQFMSNAKRMKVEQRDAEYERLRQDYLKTLEDAEEKVQLANQIYELVERYLRRLDQELAKFKIELEADNAGITSILEKRSLELDNPPPATVNHVREKRKYTFHSNSVSSNNAGVHLHHDRQHFNQSDKSMMGVSHEARDAINTSVGIITSNNITSNRISGNSFTPLLAVVSANNSANGNQVGPILTSQLPHDKNSSLPHHAFRHNLGNTAIAAAASQAIAATQQMQQGRRTASLKASYEAINSGLQICDLGIREGSLGTVQDYSNALGAGLGLDSIPSSATSVTKSGRTTKRSRTSSHLSDPSGSLHGSSFYDDESGEAVLPDENGAHEWNYDPNEPRYCICNQISYGDMVACDNEDCQKEWFHYGCVGISQPPKGKWYCPDCSEKLNKRKNRKDRS